MTTTDQKILAPIRKTRFAKRIIRGGRGVTPRAECWGAETVDGLWDFDREDSPGTPWLVYHKPSVAGGTFPLPVMLCGSLRACRVYVGSGAAGKDLAARKAEWAAKPGGGA